MRQRYLTLIARAIYIIIFITISVFPRVAHAAEPGLYFSPSSLTVSKGNTFTTNIILDTEENKVGGAGAKIIFNSDILEVDSITSGAIFDDYPSTTFDNSQGKITISGISSSPNNLYVGRGTFASITFRAKATGNTTVLFDFTPGSTTDSNIAVSFGNGDILNAVGTLSITVEDSGIGNISLPSPTSTHLVYQPIRPTSIPLDPYAPIISQVPITDPNQKQSTKSFTFISSKIPKQIGEAVSPFAFVVGFVVITLGVVVLIIIIKLRKKKKSNQPPQTPQSPMSPISID